MQAKDLEPVVDSVLNALMSIGRLMRHPVPGDALEPSAIWFLKNLGGEEARRLTDLATSTGLDASTVSRHVTQLHRQGLVERTPDPVDGRAQRVALSPLGRQRLDESLRRRHALLSRSLEDWDPADVDQLGRLLNRFVENAQQNAQELTRELENA